MRAHGLGPTSLDCKGSAVCVQWVHWVTRAPCLECPEVQCFREMWPHLFEGPQTTLAFMWQDDLVVVAKSVNACLHKMNPFEGQASDQPGVAGRDVM